MKKIDQDYSITLTDEYKEYMSALCKLASRWVPRIRAQFARLAYEKYQDPTIRRLVLAYGEELKKREHDRLSNFTYASEYELDDPLYTLEDHDCLIHDEEYGRALYLLFDID